MIIIDTNAEPSLLEPGVYRGTIIDVQERKYGGQNTGLLIGIEPRAADGTNASYFRTLIRIGDIPSFWINEFLRNVGIPFNEGDMVRLDPSDLLGRQCHFQVIHTLRQDGSTKAKVYKWLNK